MALNANPIVYDVEAKAEMTFLTGTDENHNSIFEDLFLESYGDGDELEDGKDEPLTHEEVFTYVRHINDPEHPLTLEQLRVAQEDLIKVEGSHVDIHFTPTIPHCSMATLIGLCMRVKLLRSLPRKYKVDIHITPGTHAQEEQGTSLTVYLHRRKMKPILTDILFLILNSYS